jgi:integrase
VEDRSEAAGLTGSDGAALKLHGARRGLGSELYGADAELAQETLRHKSIETTHESYREEQAVQRREDVEDVLYGDDH